MESNSLELYLLRHGIAEDRAPSGRDPDRALTDRGKEKLEKVLRRAQKSGVQPTLIISSPYKRALETAEIAARELDYHSEIVKSERLTPHSTPHDLWSEVRAHRDEPSILLAGHEPLFSAAVAWMVGSTRAMVDFKKGGLARIDFANVGADPRGVLQWLITARVS